MDGAEDEQNEGSLLGVLEGYAVSKALGETVGIKDGTLDGENEGK